MRYTLPAHRGGYPPFPPLNAPASVAHNVLLARNQGCTSAGARPRCGRGKLRPARNALHVVKGGYWHVSFLAWAFSGNSLPPASGSPRITTRIGVAFPFPFAVRRFLFLYLSRTPRTRRGINPVALPCPA